MTFDRDIHQTMVCKMSHFMDPSLMNISLKHQDIGLKISCDLDVPWQKSIFEFEEVGLNTDELLYEIEAVVLIRCV
jgi:hypothetical protein